MENDENLQEIAGKENKETQSSAYDEDNRELLDFEEIMNLDNDIIRRLKNLEEFGVTEEQIKNMYTMTADAKGGASVETALYELNKIFILLAQKITDTPNGIVVDLMTGKENPILSEIQCNQLGIEYQGFNQLSIVEKTEYFEKIMETIKFDRSDKTTASVFEEITFYKDIFEEYKGVRDRNHDDFCIKAGFNEKDIEEYRQESDEIFIKTTDEKEVMLAILEYCKVVKENKDPQRKAELEAEIEEFAEKYPDNKFIKEGLDDKEGNIDFSKVIDSGDNYLKSKNIEVVTRTLIEHGELLNFLIKDKANIPQDIKYNVAKTLAVAFKYLDSDPKIFKLVNTISKQLNIKPTFKDIKKYVENNAHIKIENEKDFETLNDIEMKDYDEGIAKVSGFYVRNEHGDKNVLSEDFIKDMREMRSKETELIYSALNDYVATPDVSDEEKMTELLYLFDHYHKTDAGVEKIIEAYICDNRLAMENFCRNKGYDIFATNSRDLRITVVKKFLEEAQYQSGTKSKKHVIDTIAQKMRQSRKENREELDEIKKNIDNCKKEQNSEQKEEYINNILEKIRNIPIAILDGSTIKNLIDLNSKEINKELSLVLSKRDEFKENIFVKDVHSNEYAEIYANINELIGKREEENINSKQDYRGFEIIKLYKEYLGKEPSINEKVLKDYILERQQYFVKRGIDIFKNTKTLDIDINKIEALVGNTIFSEESNQKMKKIQDNIGKINNKQQKTEKKNSKYLDKINKLLENSNKANNFSEEVKQTEEEILKILDKIDPKAINEDTLNNLSNFKSYNISKKLETLLVDKSQIKQLELFGLNKQTKKDIAYENIILLEAKLEITKGTSEFSNALAHRDSLYQKNVSLYKPNIETIRKNGKITAEGQKIIQNYKDTLTNKYVLKNIDKTDINNLDEESKKRFLTVLLIGTKSDNPIVRLHANEKLIVILAAQEMKEGASLARQAYELVYGKEIDEAKLDQNVLKMKENLQRKLILDKEPQSLLNDYDADKVEDVFVTNNELEAYYENHKEPLFVDINFDLEKNEMENYFNGSSIQFSKEESIYFDRVYNETSINSWITDKKKVYTYEYLELLSLKEKTNSRGQNKDIDVTIEKFLERTKGIFDPEKIKDLNKEKEEFAKYQENKYTAETLRSLSKQVANNQKYEDMTVIEKKLYLQTVISGIVLADKTDNPELKNILTKFTHRNLELMNNEETQFINIDEEGNAKIDEKNLIKEYSENASSLMKWDKVKSLDDLGKAMMYLLEKRYMVKELKDYESLDDKYFSELKGKSVEEKAAEIESRRLSENPIDDRKIHFYSDETRKNENASSLDKDKDSTSLSDSKKASEQEPDKSTNESAKSTNESKDNINGSESVVKEETTEKTTSEKINTEEASFEKMSVEEIGVEEIDTKDIGAEEINAEESLNGQNLPVEEKNGFFSKIMKKIRSAIFKNKEGINNSRKESHEEKQNVEGNLPNSLDQYNVKVETTQVTSQMSSNAQKPKEVEVQVKDDGGVR